MNATNTNNFRNVNTSGSVNNNNAYNSNGFAPGFKNKQGPERVAKSEAVPQNLKGELAPWRPTRKTGFIPKFAARYGCPDASCMVREFDGTLP